MAGRNIQGMAPQNYGQLNQANSNKAIAQARTDSKQEALFKAISNVVQASAKDIYGDVTDKKTRYVVDLILKRIEGLFAAEGISSEQIQEAVSQAVKELSTTSASKEQLEKLGKDIADKTSKLDGIEQKLESNAQKIAELKTLFGQQTTSKPQAEVSKTLKQDAFSKQTTFSKMLTTLGIDQVKNFAKLTGIVKAFHTDISSAMKASQQINVGNMADIQKKIAATQDSSMQVAKQVAQLQENVTEAIDAQQQSFFKNFEFSFKGMFTSAMKRMWTLAKFPFQIAWKLVKGPLEALIVNPLKKAMAFAKDLVTAPFKFLTDTVSKIFNGLTKGTFNILAGFLSTPAGMFALGYGLGFIWKRWVQPFWNKVVGFWDEYVSPILAPFKKWFDGNMTFTDALSASWNKLKDTVWTSWLKPKWDKFLKAHPLLQWSIEHWKSILATAATSWIIGSAFTTWLKTKIVDLLLKKFLPTQIPITTKTPQPTKTPPKPAKPKKPSKPTYTKPGTTARADRIGGALLPAMVLDAVASTTAATISEANKIKSFGETGIRQDTNFTMSDIPLIGSILSFTKWGDHKFDWLSKQTNKSINSRYDSIIKGMMKRSLPGYVETRFDIANHSLEKDIQRLISFGKNASQISESDRKQFEQIRLNWVNSLKEFNPESKELKQLEGISFTDELRDTVAEQNKAQTEELRQIIQQLKNNDVQQPTQQNNYQFLTVPSQIPQTAIGV